MPSVAMNHPLLERAPAMQLQFCPACRALGAGEDLKVFDVDNRWGRLALERVLKDITGESDSMPGVKVTPLFCTACNLVYTQ